MRAAAGWGQSRQPASLVRRPPTFTCFLGVLRNGFLKFLSVVDNSFQRYSLIVLISCDMNRGVMLKENTFIVYVTPPPSHPVAQKRNDLSLVPRVLGGFSHLKLWVSLSPMCEATWFLSRELGTSSNWVRLGQGMRTPFPWGVKLRQTGNMGRHDTKGCLHGEAERALRDLWTLASAQWVSLNCLLYWLLQDSGSHLRLPTWGLMFWQGQ